MRGSRNLSEENQSRQQKVQTNAVFQNPAQLCRSVPKIKRRVSWESREGRPRLAIAVVRKGRPADLFGSTLWRKKLEEKAGEICSITLGYLIPGRHSRLRTVSYVYGTQTYPLGSALRLPRFIRYGTATAGCLRARAERKSDLPSFCMILRLHTLTPFASLPTYSGTKELTTT